MSQTLHITSPADGTVVSPGDKIAVTVEVAGGRVPSVVLAVENPIGYTEALFSPPFRFTVQIPSRVTLRRYTVVAGLQAVIVPVTVSKSTADSKP